MCDLSLVWFYLGGLSNNCANLLFKLLSLNPSVRPSASVALSHSWFKEDQEVINNMLNINNEFCSKKIEGSLKVKRKDETFRLKVVKLSVD